MALRQNYETVDVTPSDGDEYVEALRGFLCDTGLVGLLAVIRRVSNHNYYQTRLYQFDAVSGASRGYVVVGWGGTTWIRTSPIQRTLSGAYFCEHDLSTYYIRNKSDLSSWQGTVFPPLNYWDGQNTSGGVYFFDDLQGIWCQYDGSTSQGAVSTYNSADGSDRNIRIGVGSAPAHIELMGRDSGIAFGGHMVTFFSYKNGSIFGTTRAPALQGSDTTGQRQYGYDRDFARILICDGYRLQVKGYSPISVPYGITPPIAVREPRLHEQVKIFSRVYGAAGEGIANATVTFSDQGAGKVSPVIVVTDEYGYAEANYDGLATGGAETITATVGVIEQIDVAPDQGAGTNGATWSPETLLDFDGLADNDDVSAIDPTQFDWVKGTDGFFYGASATEFFKRIGHKTSVELGIESGTTGNPSTVANGTFGGGLTATDPVGEGEELWVGVWVHFPAGFDFTVTGNLPVLRIGNDEDANEIIFGLNSAATEHSGWQFDHEGATITETRHDFQTHATGLIEDDSWHFIQFYCKASVSGAQSVYRGWLDGKLLWELDGTLAKHLESASSVITSFSAAESVPALPSATAKLSTLNVFNDWPGGAPATQKMYVSSVMWSLDKNQLLPRDSFGNRYLSPVRAEEI